MYGFAVPVVSFAGWSDPESVCCFLLLLARFRFPSPPFCGFSQTSLGLMHLRVCSHNPQAVTALGLFRQSNLGQLTIAKQDLCKAFIGL